MKVPHLENDVVKLTLLDLSNYKKLKDIANEHDLLRYSPSDISTPEAFKQYVQTAVDGYYHETDIPFIIFDKTTKTYAGSTRFGRINWHHKVLHIGWTWLGKEFQGKGLNKNIKFLMLQYAFETLQLEKVEFRIDERNIRSWKAIEKTGATLEGVLRKDTLMSDGFRRSTRCYSILKEEWDVIKSTFFDGF